MSHSINYHFTGIPTGVLTQACCDLKNSGNTLSVYITIAKNILQFPEGRKTLRKELSLRYIGEQINMHFANVHKAVKKLVKKGYIKIIEIGQDGIGSIIELIIPDENKKSPETVENTEKEKAVVKDTNIESQLVVKATTNEMLVNSTTKNNNLLKNLTNNNPERFVSSCKDNDKIETINENATENIPEASRTPQEAKLQVKTSITEKVCNDFESPEKTTEIKGISEKFLQMGIQALRDRNITEINIAIEEIMNEISLRDNVKYLDNYFLKLCREKNNWQSIVKKTATDNETREEMKKRIKQETKEVEEEEEERIRIIRENLKYNEIAEELKEKFPAEFKQAEREVIRELRKKRVYDFTAEFIRNQYIIELFQVMFPDVLK